MDKIAQKRNILDKVKEWSNISGRAAEAFFKPEFKRVMTTLRMIDNNIRSIVTGESIGEEKDMEGETIKGDPGSDSISMKDLLKSAKSNINKREYILAVSDLGRFHKKMFEVTQQLGKLTYDIDAIHHQYLFGTEDEPVLKDEHKKHLQDLKTRFARQQRMEIIKEAGIMDFFYTLSRRGRALAHWEKRFPKQVGKLKKDTAALYAKSEAIQGQLLSILKELAAARSVRNVDAYEKGAKKIGDIYKNYDGLFKTYYNENVKNFLEKVDLGPAQPVDAKDSKEMGNQPVDVEKEKMKIKTDIGPDIKTDVTMPPSGPNIPSHLSMPPVPKGPGGVAPTQTMTQNVPPLTMPSADPSTQRYVSTTPTQPYVSTTPTIVTGPPSGMTSPSLPYSPTTPAPYSPAGMPASPKMSAEEMRAFEAQHGIASEAHQKFYTVLESLSGETPRVLATFITKYARKIQQSDPATSIQLFNIVKRIKG